jgi:hypothetical protein
MPNDRITIALDPAADALLDRIADAAGKTKAQVAAEVLSAWLGATLDRLEGREPLEDALERLGALQQGLPEPKPKSA